MTKEAHQFLELIRPKGGLIVLAAMLPDGGAPNVMTYELPGEIGEAVAWMNKKAALGSNIYYQHQHVADRHLSKLRKEDITEISFLHADIDWKVGGKRIAATPEMIESCVTGLRTSQLLPPPSIIVCSGNGLQALWRLESHIDVQWPNGRTRCCSIASTLTRAPGTLTVCCECPAMSTGLQRRRGFTASRTPEPI